MSKYKKLTITGNESESFQVSGNNVAVSVETSASATVKAQTSIDNVNFTDVEDAVLTVNGVYNFNLTDLVEGQFVKVIATGSLIKVSVLG
jgi:hypothetical protein